MKKMIALMLALTLCLIAPLAMAETIEVEAMMLENGLCFEAPADWSYLELSEDEYEEGYRVIASEASTDRAMTVMFMDGDPEMTLDVLLMALNEDSDYTGAQIVSNEHGMEMVLYALADQTLIGYYVLDDAGDMYSFSFLNVEDESIARDKALLELADTCMANTYFDYDLADSDYDDSGDDAVIIQGEIPLQMMYIEDGPSCPVPVEWTEIELDDEDIADGCVAAYTEEATGRNMLIMAREAGPISTADLAEVFAADEDYASVRLMTNDHGLDMVLTVTADLTTGGYCFMGEDGWLYNFSFGLDGDTIMTDDAALAQLVQDCMANTYFEN